MSKDFLGRDLAEGAEIVYPVQHGHSVKMQRAKVIVVRENSITVQRLNPDGTPSVHQNAVVRKTENIVRL